MQKIYNWCIILSLFLFSCNYDNTKNIIHGTCLKIWMTVNMDNLYNLSGGTYHSYFVCFDEEKYCAYNLSKTGTLHKQDDHAIDVYDAIIDGQYWEIRNDSIVFDFKKHETSNQYYSPWSISKNNVSDKHLWITKNYFLVDVTEYFEIKNTNCNCEDLQAVFKISKDGKQRYMHEYQKLIFE